MKILPKLNGLELEFNGFDEVQRKIKTAINETEYNISAGFYEIEPDISEYAFNILDKQS
jgi:hypothetical protein